MDARTKDSRSEGHVSAMTAASDVEDRIVHVLPLEGSVEANAHRLGGRVTIPR